MSARLWRGVRSLGSGLTIALALPCASALAQSPAVSRPPSISRWPTLWIGGGVAAGNGQGGADRVSTAAGGAMSAALEWPRTRTVGIVSLALRGEALWSQQSLTSEAGSGLSGDVQRVSGGLSLRVSPRRSTATTPRRLTPYLLVGAGLTRPSTRVDVVLNNPDMPTSHFGQTSSEVAATGIGGIGALWRVGPWQLFLEARSELASRNAGTARSTFGTLGFALPIQR